MLTDSFLDKRGSSAPAGYICGVLVEVCIPLTGRRIVELRTGNVNVDSVDELMIEFELCIKLIFKPLRHHITRVVDANGDVLGLWKSILKVLEDILKDETATATAASPGGSTLVSNNLLKTMNELANEHLQNAIMFLISAELITGEPESPGDFTSLTWDSVGRMGFCKGFVDEWKKAALNPPVASN